MLYLLFILCVSLTCKAEWFSHDRAAVAAQKEDWQGALDRLNNLLIDRPDDRNILYDAGVSTYKLKNYHQAQDYFKKAIQNSSADKQLQERSYFNLGNCQVALDNLKEAIESYQKALELDPSDEHAKSNLAKVKELLKQQEQKKKEEEQKKQQEKEQKDKQDKQDKDQQDQQNQDQKQDQQDQQKDQKDKSDKSQSDQKKNQTTR